jgi:hypothetical protein
MSRSGAALGAIVFASTLAGCGGHVPSEPDVVAVSGSAADGLVVSFAEPTAVFRTTPRADAGGNIPGGFPLQVTFNTCPSTDTDEGDRLKTTYDFDGDGVVDYAGHCRQTHVFEDHARPRICVTDRTPDHQVCRSYVVGGTVEIVPLKCPRDRREEFAEVEPNGAASGAMGPFGDSVLISGQLSGDGDDAFSFVNNCEVPITVEGQTFGPGGPGDCSAPPSARLLVHMEAGSEVAVHASPLGSACTTPSKFVGLPPGQQFVLRITYEGEPPPAYVLRVLMVEGGAWLVATSPSSGSTRRSSP